jgi:hypothetical protein
LKIFSPKQNITQSELIETQNCCAAKRKSMKLYPKTNIPFFAKNKLLKSIALWPKASALAAKTCTLMLQL